MHRTGLHGLGFTRVSEGQGVAPADQVDMLIKLTDRLEIQTFDLIASDSGGAVAQLLMLRRPGRLVKEPSPTSGWLPRSPTRLWRGTG